MIVNKEEYLKFLNEVMDALDQSRASSLSYFIEQHAAAIIIESTCRACYVSGELDIKFVTAQIIILMEAMIELDSKEETKQ